MIKKFLIQKYNVPFYIIILTLILIIFYLFYFDRSVNIINNNLLVSGVGWENNQSKYSGSELSFGFTKSNEVIFEFNTDSDSEQTIEIFVDEKKYLISSPNLDTQKLSIATDKDKSHSVAVRHTCVNVDNKCQISVKGIYLERGSKITHYRLHYKVLSLLGDSISTIYGGQNFSQVLANSLGYELHNASILKSTVSETSKSESAIKRYKKDLMTHKSDVIIIFLGTNDASKNVPLNVFKKDYQKIVSDVKEYNSDGKLFLVGLLPRSDINYLVIQDYNEIIKQVAKEYNVNFIDPYNFLNISDFSDAIHPSFESQIKLANQFEKELSPYLK